MQHQDILIGFVLMLTLGVGAQWIAWWLKLPSILLLLAFGILAGPVSALVLPGGQPLLDPARWLGDDLLLPLISMAVGLILYEGGLTLRFRDIAANNTVVWKLISLGALVTWVGVAAGGILFLGLSPGIAVLLGAILTVTGPTVIGPLLTHVRPIGPSGPILRWEGIAIDPIGALLAVLVFEILLVGRGGEELGMPLASMLRSVVLTVVVGGGMGAAAAWLLVFLLKRYLVPEQLQNPVSLMLVMVVFALSDLVQKESGLLATTIMGIVLANQRVVGVHHILEFKENLRVLLLSMLFIVLGARLDLAGFKDIGLGVIPFIVVLIVFIRPAGVFLSTMGSKLGRKQRLLIAMIAPRGIVAAAVASVFGLALESEGIPGAELLSPIVFTVILVTVVFYGLTAAPLARRLGIADTDPQGLLIVGAFPWVRDLALALHDRGVKIRLVDANYQNIQSARMAGLNVWYGNALGEHAMDEIDLTGIGRVFAATPNDEVNALVAQRFSRILDKANIYQLIPHQQGTKRKGISEDLQGRAIGSDTPTFEELDSYHQRGGIVKVTTLSNEFTYDQFRMLYGKGAKVLFVLRDKTKLDVVTGQSPDPEPGDTIFAVVNPDELFML